MYTYLALGDSYTCGEAVEAAQTFPRQLAAQLRAQGEEVATPKVIAVAGWTTGELQAAVAAEPLGETFFDLVTLLIGVNNQYRGPQKGYTLEGYQGEFVGLLQTAIRCSGNDPARVTVLSIPDWGAMPFAEGRDRAAIAADIDAYNAVNRRVTERHGARYVDITPISREAAYDRSLIASDGLHPSGAMYAKWVQAMPVLSLTRKRPWRSSEQVSQGKELKYSVL